MTQRTTLPTDGLPPPERLRAMITLAIAVAMSVLDSSVANIALPTIATELHTNPASSIWVVNAYQLSVTVSLLPLASLGDIIGYKRVYWVGRFAPCRRPCPCWSAPACCRGWAAPVS
jgi:DHA2 family multidrug resistance protein-like MFS transporter